MITYKSTNLFNKFPVKDKPDFEHKNNITYRSKYPNERHKDDYIGERN